jgi:hypothetical protein
VHRAAHLLANSNGRSGAEVGACYEELLATVAAERETLGALAPTVDQFLRVTASYEPGLFHRYEVDGLPRTNNDLEQFFGSARYHERRSTGRKAASPALVVRGSVRAVAAVATPAGGFGAEDLRPPDLARWRELRDSLAYRHETRRAQLRFRRDPQAYLTALEDRLLKLALPP